MRVPPQRLGGTGRSGEGSPSLGLLEAGGTDMGSAGRNQPSRVVRRYTHTHVHTHTPPAG